MKKKINYLIMILIFGIIPNITNAQITSSSTIQVTPICQNQGSLCTSGPTFSLNGNVNYNIPSSSPNNYSIILTLEYYDGSSYNYLESIPPCPLCNGNCISFSNMPYTWYNSIPPGTNNLSSFSGIFGINAGGSSSVSSSWNGYLVRLRVDIIDNITQLVVNTSYSNIPALYLNQNIPSTPQDFDFTFPSGYTNFSVVSGIPTYYVTNPTNITGIDFYTPSGSTLYAMEYKINNVLQPYIGVNPTGTTHINYTPPASSFPLTVEYRYREYCSFSYTPWIKKQVLIGTGSIPCNSTLTISGLWSTPISESQTWIKNSGATTISPNTNVVLDADPINGYILLTPDFLSAPDNMHEFIAQAYNGCTVGLPQRIKNPNPIIEEDNFTIFPNPTSSIVTISNSKLIDEMIDIEIMSFDGKILKKVNNMLFNQNAELNLENLIDGIYLVKIKRKSETKIFKIQKIN